MTLQKLGIWLLLFFFFVRSKSEEYISIPLESYDRQLFCHNRMHTELNNQVFPLIDCFYKPTRRSAICIFNTQIRRDSFKDAVQKWTWRSTFTYHHNQTYTSRGLIITMDGHEHTISIEFPFPKHIDVAPSHIQVEAIDGSEVKWSLSDGHNKLPLQIAKLPSSNYTLVACTSIGGKFWQEQNIDDAMRLKRQAQAVCLWVFYHLASGFQHILLYLDFEHEDFYVLLKKSLRSELESGKVTLLRGFIVNRRDFELQQAHGTHCLYWYKDSASWLGYMDVDEYFQVGPNSKATSIVQTVKEISQDKMINTIQVYSQFWGGESGWSINIPNLKFHKEGYIMDSRQKCIFNVDEMYYFSVHVPTTPTTDIYNPDPQDCLRLNHYKHFGGIGDELGMVEDDTFEQFWKMTFESTSNRGNLADLMSNEEKILEPS